MTDLSGRRGRHGHPVPVAVTGRKSKPAAGDVTVIRGGAVTLAKAADAFFLSSPGAASPSTRRAYVGALGRLAAELGPHRQLAAVPGQEIAADTASSSEDLAAATVRGSSAHAVTTSRGAGCDRGDRNKTGGN